MQVVLDGLRLAVGLAAISELQYILLCVCVCNLPEKKFKKGNKSKNPHKFQ